MLSAPTSAGKTRVAEVALSDRKAGSIAVSVAHRFLHLLWYVRQKLRIAKQYQGTQCGGALQTTTRRRTGDSTFRTERKNGDTETYKALPRKDIFRTLSVVERNASKQYLEVSRLTTLKVRKLSFRGSTL